MNRCLIVSLIILVLTLIFLGTVFAGCNNTTEFISSNVSMDNSILSSNKEVLITDDNYDQYFYMYTGEIKSDAMISSGDTLKIGNVSNKLFVIDRPLNITTITPYDQISNGVIHLVSGSSGSTVSGLTINNTEGEIKYHGVLVSKLHGIWLSNSSNNLISHNIIRIGERFQCYAMPMGYSNNNTIIYNDMKTYITCCIVMGSCHHDNISYNRIEILKYSEKSITNLIYFNPYGHADYQGPATCVGTYISNNYLKGCSNEPFSIILQVLGKSDNTTIINNTVIRGSVGINVYDGILASHGYPMENILIKNNTIINSLYSIGAGGKNVSVYYNKIFGSSMECGIEIAGHDEGYVSDVSVLNNLIEYKNLYYGILINAKSFVCNNTVNIFHYGVGIGLGVMIETNNSRIIHNFINVYGDNGINFLGNNHNISDNVINTKMFGISSINKNFDIRYHNNTILGNTIYSDSYGIYIEGYIYSTLIKNNVIETNQSIGIYKNIKDTIEYKDKGINEDNMINGVIYDTEALIINDDNFYEYFDENGYLNYTFKEGANKFIFFTFLSNKNIYFDQKITVISNRMSNLLYNVTICFKDDASDSIIRDFKFYNFNKSSIILDGVDRVFVSNNNFTTISRDIFETTVISIKNGCNKCIINKNNIYVNSKSNYTYGISALAFDSKINKISQKLSKDFTISNNNILIRSSSIAEGMYFDSLVKSEIINNNINIISDTSAYGIATANIIGRPYELKIDFNEIVISAKDMTYLIELHMSDNCEIIGNYLEGTSNGVYGLGIYNSNNITSFKNKFVLCGGNLSKIPNVPDVLGKGNAAIYLIRSSIINCSQNMFDVKECELIVNKQSTILNLNNNSYVIAYYNYNKFFDSDNRLFNGIMVANDNVLFKNFTFSKVMILDLNLNIFPYKEFNEFRSSLILIDNASGSNIFGFNFIDSYIKLNSLKNVNIFNNLFKSNSTVIEDVNGFDNSIFNCTFLISGVNVSGIIFNNSSNDNFINNILSLDANFTNAILIVKSRDLLISNSSVNAIGRDIIVINSYYSRFNQLFNNNFTVNGINSIHVYKALNNSFDLVLNNTIYIEATLSNTNQSAIYYGGESSSNKIKFNKIISNSVDCAEYAIVFIWSSNLFNEITYNYLISGNGSKRADYAVYARYDLVCNNTPFYLYVSVNGSDSIGDGSIYNPYYSIATALKNCLNNCVIYVLPGTYYESNLLIDKNITLTAINLEGNTYIDALGNQLFNINNNGILVVNALKVFNGFSVKGGSLFVNNGSLILNNSMIYNSSSYYNNSNPQFTGKPLIYNQYDYSYDCSDLGLGGAILNYGSLLINSCSVFNNFAHKGGALADFGKTIVINSLFYNNTGVHGGAVYTDSKEDFIIVGSYFRGNLALTTLDHCYIKKTDHRGTIYDNHQYQYYTMCEAPCGHGGAIYSNSSLIIHDSLFEYNVAKSGGAISFYSILDDEKNYVEDHDYWHAGLYSKYNSQVSLDVSNSLFRNNIAKDTRSGNFSLLVEPWGHYITFSKYFQGGGIFGSLKEFTIVDSTFEYNKAYNNGGALSLQSENGLINNCKFSFNTGGRYGGALDLFGNIVVTNTEITNNSANYGGALQYSSYEYYNHLQNNLNMFNVTIADNVALTRGGAISATIANLTISNSNIYGNTAPREFTFHDKWGTSYVDARNNWWGSVDGPDDSVWNVKNIRFREWLSDRVNWKPTIINNSGSNNSSDNHSSGNGNKINNPIFHGILSSSTGFGSHTGSTLGNGGSLDSNGDNDGFPGLWPGASSSGGSGEHGSSGNGSSSSSFLNSSDNSKSSINGNSINPNSLSKINSSSIFNLLSVGLTPNAADSSSCSASSSVSESSSSSKAYEVVKKTDKHIIDSNKYVYYLIFALVLFFLLILGYKFKKYDK